MSSQPKPVSYLRAWLTSQTNVMTLLGGGLAMAVASVPAGGAGALGALVVLGAVQTLLALVIPDLPTFRSKVDRGARRGAIHQRRAQLQQELFALHGGIEVRVTYGEPFSAGRHHGGLKNCINSLRRRDAFTNQAGGRPDVGTKIPGSHLWPSELHETCCGAGLGYIDEERSLMLAQHLRVICGRSLSMPWRYTWS